MKVKQLTNDKNRPVNNHFIITDGDITLLQSYDVIIYKNDNTGQYLDKNYYNYSVTTSKWRNYYLGTTSKEVDTRIKSGIYKLVNLNGPKNCHTCNNTGYISSSEKCLNCNS